MKNVTLAGRIGFCSLAAALLLLFVGPASADEIGTNRLIVGKWEMVKGPEGHPKWDIEFTRDGAVLVYAGQLTLQGKYRVLDKNTIETEIRSIVDPKKVTFNKLGIKVGFEELTITDGNIETHYRRVKTPAAKAPAGKAAANVNPDAKVRQLIKRLVEEQQQALIRGDYARVVDMTLPKVIESLGGRDNAITEIKALVERVKSYGITFKLEGVEMPTDFAKAGNTLYAVVPYTLQMSGAGMQITQTGFVIGVSSDEGQTWTFIDGGDAEGLRRFLPDLPKQLRLPQASQ